MLKSLHPRPTPHLRGEANRSEARDVGVSLLSVSVFQFLNLSLSYQIIKKEKMTAGRSGFLVQALNQSHKTLATIKRKKSLASHSVCPETSHFQY